MKKIKQKFKLGYLVRISDRENKVDTTNRSFELYTMTEKFDDALPTYRTNKLPE